MVEGTRRDDEIGTPGSRGFTFKALLSRLYFQGFTFKALLSRLSALLELASTLMPVGAQPEAAAA